MTSIAELLEKILKESNDLEEAKIQLIEATKNKTSFAEFYIEICNIYSASKEKYQILVDRLVDVYNDCFVFDYFRISSAFAKCDYEKGQEAFHQISAKYLFAGIEDFCAQDYNDVVSSLDTVLNCIELSENKRLFIEMKLAEVQLLHIRPEDFDSYDELLTVLGEYAMKTADFYNLYFKNYAFGGDLEMLPDRARYSGFFGGYLDAAMEGDVDGAYGMLKEMLKAYNPLESITLRLTELYGERLAKGV